MHTTWRAYTGASRSWGAQSRNAGVPGVWGSGFPPKRVSNRGVWERRWPHREQCDGHLLTPVARKTHVGPGGTGGVPASAPACPQQPGDGPGPRSHVPTSAKEPGAPRHSRATCLIQVVPARFSVGLESIMHSFNKRLGPDYACGAAGQLCTSRRGPCAGETRPGVDRGAGLCPRQDHCRWGLHP